MSYGYEIHPEAQKEYLKSIEWYLERSDFATQLFIDTIKHGIAVICNDPKMFKKSKGRYHELVLLRCPFTIVYKIDPLAEKVVIMAIYHQSRNPKLKYR